MASDAQPEVNIGLVGHVDHGKTTLTKALSGMWTDKHSEEIKRGVSIRLGYADCMFYKCPECEEPECYCSEPECEACGSETELLRKVSFVDSPGHETLMATMLSGAAIMDGAVLVVAANEECPQPQTAEHLMALEILGVDNIVVAQNKIDLVSPEEAKENFNQIKDFIKNSEIKDAVIIPMAAHYGANTDVLIKAIEDYIPTPERDLTKDPQMRVARSFDVNKPGTKPKDLRGGVIGGSLTQGKFEIGDEVQIVPGVRTKKKYQPLTTEIVSLNSGKAELEEATPGGLIAIGTNLDPSLTKADNLSGNVVGTPGKLPEPREELTLDINLLDELIGSKEEEEIKPLVKNEPLMLAAGSAVTVGTVTNPGDGVLKLKLPICVEKEDRVALSRRFGTRWRLIGYGTVQD